MRIHRDCRFTESDIQDDIRGFPSTPWKFLQSFAVLRNLPSMLFDQRLRQSNDVLGLCVEKTNGLDGVAELVLAKDHHLLRRVRQLE